KASQGLRSDPAAPTSQPQPDGDPEVAARSPGGRRAESNMAVRAMRERLAHRQMLSAPRPCNPVFANVGFGGGSIVLWVKGRGSMKDALHYMSIGAVSARVRAKEISPVELVNACLARIAELNPRLNAFITVLADRARQQARTAEAEVQAGRWRGPLHGIPVGIKDFYDTANVRTTAAFEGFEHRSPAKDAVAVAKLNEAGAIVVGKTNMHRLGRGTTGLGT